MDTQTIGYKNKSMQPKFMLVYLLINPMLWVALSLLFSFRILPWDSSSPIFDVVLTILNFAATIMAFVLTGIADGKQGVKDLWGRLWTRHVSIGWVLVALSMWFIVFAIIKLFAAAMDGTPFFPFFRPFDEIVALFPGGFLFAIFNGFREDFGWFGYLLPRLQAKWNALASSLVVGFFWGLIHLGNWLLPPGNPIRTNSFFDFWLTVILFTILATWLFNKTNGKLLPVMLAHAMMNCVGGLMMIPDSYWLYVNWVLLIMVIPVVLIFGAKDRLGRGRGEKTSQIKVPAVGA